MNEKIHAVTCSSCHKIDIISHYHKNLPRLHKCSKCGEYTKHPPLEEV